MCPAAPTDTSGKASVLGAETQLNYWKPYVEINSRQQGLGCAALWQGGKKQLILQLLGLISHQEVVCVCAYA